MQNMIFPMSENWWIEKEKAYFCGTRISALFCVDLNSLQCEIVSWLPEHNRFDFFVNPYCMKYKDAVVCLPGTGNKIWLYDTKKEAWKKIEIENTGQLIISMESCKHANGKVWLLEYDTGKILQVDYHKGNVERKYQLSYDGEEIYYGEYVIVQDKLYTTVRNRVYGVDVGNGNILIYEIPDVKVGLFTICYDGVNFWLGGYGKEIYIWNPEQGLVKSLTEFPKEFGIYHFHEAPDIDCATFSNTADESPFFEHSFVLGKYIWYIPNQSNGIVYVDRETYKIYFLEIEKERETKESLERDYAAKFLFLYIREERYIGIYSIQNQWIFEVDAVMLCVEYKEYELSGESILELAKDIGEYDDGQIFQEKKEKDAILFSAMLETNNKAGNKQVKNIGEQIYHIMDES